ncbi:hypothetical protein KEM55_008856 [Ascosphaera atra]|nr:hypothetical protein KEM55_008856 [Ascosphaera atra]
MAPTSQFGYATPHRPDALFYEVLEESLSEFESKKVVKLGWFPEGLNKEVNVELLVPKQGNVADVIEHLRAKVGAPREKWPNIRLFEVHNNRIYKEVPESYGVTGLNEYVGLYAEPVPVEETEMGEEEYLVNAFHYDKEPNRPHGIPFKLVVKPGELFKATKERVAKRINVRGKSLEKITFTILSRPYNQYPPRRLEDDDVLSDYITVDNERVLGLEHPNKTRYFWDRSASFSIR